MLGSEVSLNKISKATKMVVLEAVVKPESTRRLCDYHYYQLVDNGTKIYATSTILPDAGIQLCDMCEQEAL